jgi:hypothetical protein
MKKALLFIISAILITAMIPFTFSVWAAEVTVLSFDMVFDTALSSDFPEGDGRAIVRLYKDGADPDSAEDKDYVNLHIWRAERPDNIRFGIAQPSIGNPLSLRHDFESDLYGSTNISVKITKNTTDGKWMMYVNDVKINEVNWNTDNADNPTKETDNIYYWSEESKREPAGTWGDTFDFLMNPVSTWKVDVNPNTAVNFTIENLVITDPDQPEQPAETAPATLESDTLASETPAPASNQVSAAAPLTSDSFSIIGISLLAVLFILSGLSINVFRVFRRKTNDLL